MPAKINLTNQKFNKLLVLSESNNKKGGRVTWKCLCDCGNEVEVTAKNLRDGTTQSCGCLKKKNIIGKKYGRLTVIDYTNFNRHGSAVWKCACECGNITYATTEGLRVGDNISCGCYNKSCELFKQRYKVNLVGEKFGKLIVIKATEKRTAQGNQIWECQCECGNIAYVSTNHLQTGNTKSCGCLLGHSVGEQKIIELLNEHNIKFKAQYIFPELPNRRYDFAIFDIDNNLSYLIEFDGEQHYIENNFFNTSLEEQQQIDNEKTLFANKMGIPLLRIPYWKRDTLTYTDLEIENEQKRKNNELY